MKQGYWYALFTYLLWGLLPVYWKGLHQIPAIQVIGHRIIWSCLFLSAAIFLTGKGKFFRAALRRPRVLPVYLAAAALIGVNWLVYVWAVNAGFIVETSLGYFINPLVSVFLGVLFLRERLRPWQWAPIGLATAGVLYLTVSYGSLPWISLTLAFSFGLYGLVKKLAPLGSLYGLTLETGILFLPALAYLLFAESAGQGAFLHTVWATALLLAGSGVVTAVPMLTFAMAARRIPLSQIGLFQYLSPTLQFLLGVLVYHEPFTHNQLIGFGMVWTALAIYVFEGVTARRSQLAARAA